jgi:hypothetical protein
LRKTTLATIRKIRIVSMICLATLAVASPNARLLAER